MRIVLFLLFALNISWATAQDFRAGLLGGMTTSQISGDNLEGYDKLGFRIGAYVSRSIKEKVDVKMEIQYIQKGSKRHIDKHSFERYMFNLHYIEIPISIAWKYNQDISIETGLSPSYLMAYSEQNELGNLPKNDPKSIGLDFLVGANYQIKPQIILNLRYSQSVIPVRKHSSEGQLGLNNGQQSSLLSLALYYQFN